MKDRVSTLRSKLLLGHHSKVTALFGGALCGPPRKPEFGGTATGVKVSVSTSICPGNFGLLMAYGMTWHPHIWLLNILGGVRYQLILYSFPFNQFSKYLLNTNSGLGSVLSNEDTTGNRTNKSLLKWSLPSRKI